MNLHERFAFAAASRNILTALLVASSIQFANAGSATWNLNPVSGDWSTPANWTPATVPSGFGDHATFGASNITSISTSSNIQLTGLVFNADANAYTITIQSNFFFWFRGSSAVVNNSAFVPAFIVDHGPAGSLSALLNISESTSAGNVMITNKGATAVNGQGGVTEFSESATAGNAFIINSGAEIAEAEPGHTSFTEGSNAGSATITCNGGTTSGAGGGITFFSGTPSGGTSANSATLIANGGLNGGSGGSIFFGDYTDGGTARVILSGGGVFDITGLIIDGIAIGSIEGGGDFYLGKKNLKVGTNNLSRTVSGVIHDGGHESGVGGSLSKTGTGTLTLTSANTYTGGTTIEAGSIEALHAGALGTGNVSLVNAGAGLTLQYQAIASAAALSVVSGSTVNLPQNPPRQVASLIVDGVVQLPGFYGSAASGAPNQLPEFTGPGQVQVIGPTAVSRVSQGGNTFDLYVPLQGKAQAVESRSGGVNNVYQLVVSYLNPVTFNSVSVTSGTGMVTGTSGNGTPTITINLAGVTNAQRITVTLFGVNDATTTKDIPIKMGFLIGDTTGDGRVNSSDITQAKTLVGQPISNTNFRADVTDNGSINASDIALIKSKSGTSLPFMP